MNTEQTSKKKIFHVYEWEDSVISEFPVKSLVHEINYIPEIQITSKSLRTNMVMSKKSGLCILMKLRP